MIDRSYLKKDDFILPTEKSVDQERLDSEARTKAVLAAAVDAIITIDEWASSSR